MKTLEQTAEEYVDKWNTDHGTDDLDSVDLESLFKAGAQWERERSKGLKEATTKIKVTVCTCHDDYICTACQIEKEHLRVDGEQRMIGNE